MNRDDRAGTTETDGPLFWQQTFGGIRLKTPRTIVAAEALFKQILTRNDAVRLGARGVPPAVFGVPPKTPALQMDPPFEDGWMPQGRVGGTPAGATGTVALPISATSFRLKKDLNNKGTKIRRLDEHGNFTAVQLLVPALSWLLRFLVVHFPIAELRLK